MREQPAADDSPRRLTILVYHEDRLAVRFVRGFPPAYSGEAGERVRTLVEADGLRYNPWSLEVREGGLHHDSDHWFLTSVLLGTGLAQAGFRMASFNEPG